MNHTPGPWQFRSGAALDVETNKGLERLITPPHVVKISVNDDGLRTTAFVCACESTTLPNEANARLIAASPRLLLVAQAASHALKSYQHGNSSPMLAKEIAAALDEAIADAEGRQ